MSIGSRHSVEARSSTVDFCPKTGRFFATRSTGQTVPSEASSVILQLMHDLDLPALAAAKKQTKASINADDERFRDMGLSEFFAWYWSDDGYYVQDRKTAKKPLSTAYLYHNRQYLEHYIGKGEGFRTTPLRATSFALVDRFFREVSIPAQSCHPTSGSGVPCRLF